MSKEDTYTNDIEKYHLLLLDELRIKNGLSIEQFVKGIVSKRNYSRYLSNDAKINFDIFDKLINRLNLTIVSFSYYVINSTLSEHSYEIDFFNDVFNKNYEVAYKNYNEKIKDQRLYTFLSETAVPCAGVYLNYRLEKISKETARIQMKKILNLKEALSKHIYSDDQVGAIYMYSQVADNEEKKQIETFLIDFLINNNRKSFPLQNEVFQYHLYIMFLQILTDEDHQHENTSRLFEIVMSKVLDFDRRAKVDVLSVFVLEMLYNYTSSKKLPQREKISFYYISTLLSLKDNEKIKNQTFKIKRQDYKRFLSQIKNEEYLFMELYEGLINHDYL